MKSDELETMSSDLAIPGPKREAGLLGLIAQGPAMPKKNKNKNKKFILGIKIFLFI